MQKQESCMKNIVVGLVALSLIFGGCSKNDASSGNKATSGKNRSVTLRVEGYIAKKQAMSGSFTSDGALLAMDQVDLKAETSGRLVTLYVKDGQNVAKGALLAKLDDSELRASLKQAEANLDYAQKQQARTKTLYEKDGATAETLESAEASLRDAEASKELIAAQIAKTEIRAPFSGKLGVIAVSVGAWMTSGTLLATLSDVHELKVEFDLPQRYAANLKIGNTVTINDGERSISAPATVRFLDATLSESSRTRKVRAVLKNSDGKFFAGSFVSVSLHFETPSAIPTPIPTEAVTLDNVGAYVFVAKGGNAVQTRVETGLRTPISVGVVKGLADGDTVIVSGLMNMHNGSSVIVKEIRNEMHYEVTE